MMGVVGQQCYSGYLWLGSKFGVMLISFCFATVFVGVVVLGRTMYDNISFRVAA